MNTTLLASGVFAALLAVVILTASFGASVAAEMRAQAGLGHDREVRAASRLSWAAVVTAAAAAALLAAAWMIGGAR